MYCSTFNSTTAEEVSPLCLLPHHLAELKLSGLSDATISAAGIYSEDNYESLASQLNWLNVPKRMAPALVFPFVDEHGNNGYSRIKPDNPRTHGGKTVKYESPRGVPNRIYLPPGVGHILQHPDQELLITEGEKKALKATQDGFPCIGLVGVFGWKDGKTERLLPQLGRIAWKGRQVRIVFDSDIAENPLVRDAAARLAKLLTNLGALVRVVRLPSGAPSLDGRPTKVGLDDFLVAYGPEALRNLLNSATEPDPVSATNTKVDARELDPGDEARAYLNKDHLDGVRTLQFWRGMWWKWNQGAYHEVKATEVRNAVLRNLDSNYRKLGTDATNNVLDHVRAQAELSSQLEVPNWIGLPTADWQPTEILATRKTLVHLPSLTTDRNGIIATTPRFFTTAALDFDFDPAAPCPERWRGFLLDLWPDDIESINCLQEWMGYLLTPDTRQQKILLLIGPKRSGKSTICRIIRELIGAGNEVGPTLTSLAGAFGLQPLVGKSVAIIHDARLGGRSDKAVIAERLLSISGEDALTIDRKYAEAVTYKLPTRLMVISNELPRLTDASGALASRFITLSIRPSFIGKEDQELFSKLKSDLPGILLWAIDGWRRLRERGRFIQPASGLELVNEMADLSSPIGAFVREKCVVAPAAQVQRHTLYESYRRWATENGRGHLEDEAGFGRELRAAVPSLGSAQPNIAGKRVRHYTGIMLRESGGVGTSGT